jgi:hypothetical protein
LELRARLPGAARITFHHNARQVAEIAGESGRAVIDTRLLGQGTVRIEPFGRLRTDDGGDSLIRGRPIEVEIAPPTAGTPSSRTSGK